MSKPMIVKVQLSVTKPYKALVYNRSESFRRVFDLAEFSADVTNEMGNKPGAKAFYYLTRHKNKITFGRQAPWQGW